MNDVFDHQSFEQHPLIEFEEEAFLFAFLALIVIRATADQLGAGMAAGLFPLSCRRNFPLLNNFIFWLHFAWFHSNRSFTVDI